MHSDFAPVMVLWGIVLMVAWIVWVTTNNRRRTQIAQAQAEMQMKLLDRMAASQELAGYLNTDAGRRLLESVGTEKNGSSAQSKILSSIQAGAICLLTGVAMMVMSSALDIDRAGQGILLLGTMSSAVGAGFLISAGISYTLSKSWGLFDTKKPDGAP